VYPPLAVPEFYTRAVMRTTPRECPKLADFVEKLFRRALWLYRGEYHFTTQLIANPDSKNHRGAKRYTTVGV
jgi:hypothetical protein